MKLAPKGLFLIPSTHPSKHFKHSICTEMYPQSAIAEVHQLVSDENTDGYARLLQQSDKMYKFCEEITSALKDKGKLSIWETCIKKIADDIIKEVEDV